jgi:hypothetical protein
MVTPTLPKFIPISEAVQKTRYTEKTLRSMLHAGKIGGGTMNGELLVDANTIPTRKEDLKEYKRYGHLSGVGIWISEASRKYTIPTTTLYQWFQKGYIKSIGRDGQKVLLNEQDVAYCASVYKKNKGQGKRLFNKDGTPYRPKNDLTST